MLEKSLVMVKNDDDDGDGDVHVADPEALSDQFRLFKHSTPGISLHYVGESMVDWEYLLNCVTGLKDS